MASLPKRDFTATEAVREHVPLLIGLTGPSGGGKTFSALRLATGIQTVTGGDIFFIDTESRRALHYADRFKFKHVEFQAPYGSLDYLAALQFCVAQGAGVVIVDSMSHEHEGPGGMVDLHDQIVERMAGDDYAKRERVKMLAWSEPKQKRRALINGILQLNANFIFCFRAKNASKPGKDERGKSAVIPMGFMPIAGEEFVFEQTLNALLLPGAGGVPTWQSDQPGERTMIKLPEQFAALRGRDKPLDESVGRRLAMWAAGTPAAVEDEPTAKQTGARTFRATDTANPSPEAPHAPGGQAAPNETDGQEGAVSEHEEAGELDALRVTADRLIAEAKGFELLADLKAWEGGADFESAYATLDDDLKLEVDGEIATRRRKLSGGK